VLLPSQQIEEKIHVFFLLASLLLSRFSRYGRPEDIKCSLQYFRFLRINFHPLQAFNTSIPLGQFLSRLVGVLAYNLMSGAGYMMQDMTQDMEEMASITHELLSSDVLTSDLIPALEAFSAAVASYLDDAKPLPEKVVQVLREVEIFKLPDAEVPDSKVRVSESEVKAESERKSRSHASKLSLTHCG
jgi:hypothetical protein